MDDQSSTTTLPQVKAGPLWLQKINSDIIFSITTWLNPLSILSLSLTCRYLRYTIRDDRLIWSHAMRHTAAEHCIAPHSLDDLSINDLRLFSTRPARLMNYLKNPENSPQVKITKCTLDFGPLLAAPSSGNTKLTPELEYLAADILQGGRWIISGAINHTTQTTYICCWDRLGFISEDIPLQPVATVTWEGFRPKKPRRGANWLHAQLGENRSVVLAIPVHRWESTWSISYELLRIQWTPNEHVPTIESAARLAQADYHALDNDTSDYRLEGPYLILESMDGIVIWDWQHDEIGRADDEGHEWANGAGFLMATIPPYLFIIHRHMGHISVTEIPQLQPVGTAESLERICPPSSISYPLITDMEVYDTSGFFIIDSWKPPSHRSGMVVLYTDRYPKDEGPLVHVISLRPTAAVPPRPSCVLQSKEPFPGDWMDFNCMSVLNGVGAVLLDRPLSFSWEEDVLGLRFHSFTEEGVLDTPIDRRYDFSLPCHGNPSSICLVSGVAILKSQDPGIDPYTQVVGIISLEF